MLKLIQKLSAPIMLLLIFISPIFADNPYIKSKELYLKYTSLPSYVYGQQRFTLVLEARILAPEDTYDFVQGTYQGGKNIELVSGEICWKKANDNKYTTEITYKVTNKNFKLPTIVLSLELEDEVVDSISIVAPTIRYTKIAINQKNFSNVIASDLKINSIQTKQYNNKMLMVIFNIETTDGNLEEFYLNQFDEQGINSYKTENLTQSIYYYVIIPSYITNISFDYFNPKTSEFTNVQLPISLEEDLISTQTDLNPNNSDLLFYKQTGSAILLALFILLYLGIKNKLIFIPIGILIIIIVKLYMPNKIIHLSQGTNVYILPTKLSTIYKVIERDRKVEILIEQKNFLKVLFKNKHIGWVRQKDVK